MKKVCLISNIFLSVVYVVFSWFILLLGYLLLLPVLPDHWADFNLFYFASCFTFMGTPLFCIAGIVTSVITRRKGRDLLSFLIQFVPVATTLLAGIFMIIAMVIDGM